MDFVFKQETFRDSFTFANSPDAVRRFPFPFDQDRYSYSVNIEPHTGGPRGSVTEFPIDIDEHYLSEMRERDLVLREDSLRCQSLPHMKAAEWDLLELLMSSLSKDYPAHFSLDRDGNKWHWVNRPMAIEQSFDFGDERTIPCGPMEYIGRQCQGDFCLLDQRDGNLWMDAGIVSTPADWSLDFDLGMNFIEWHGPVPLAHGMGVFDRALKFLLNLQQGRPVRRLNWTMTVHPRLDTSPEQFHKWGCDRCELATDAIGSDLFLRVELQALFRLGRSNAIVFSIRTYLASLNDIASNPVWKTRLASVLSSLPPELVAYKGLTAYKDKAIQWLQR